MTTPSAVEYHRIVVAAIREAGHYHIADIILPAEWVNSGACAVAWLRLGREPTLDEVQTVVNASFLAHDRLIGWGDDVDRTAIDRRGEAEKWLAAINLLWSVSPGWRRDCR